jgi:NhaA family Na+:H+ antiporter
VFIIEPKKDNMAQSKIYPAHHWSETPIARFLRPMQRFIERSEAGGIVLMVATLVALVLANSPLAESYNALLHTEIGITVGTFELQETVAHWVNDGLMVIFFFLVGLEIKREVRVGELSNVRAALLPILAATGGAITPAIIYTLINYGGPGAPGWGVPMATDIAFALGCLALLGSRVPFSLKVFLAAIAIADDLIAVLVIALFYSSTINFTALGFGLFFLVLLMLGNIFGIRSTLFYAMLGLLVWFEFLQSGIHATIAGVLIAWTIPARNRIDASTFLKQSQSLLDCFARSKYEPTRMLTDEAQQTAVIALEEACQDVQAPLQKMEHSLHMWVAFIILPVFALANAGVTLSLDSLRGDTSLVALGIIVGLVLGKPIGIIGSVWLMVRSGITTLPPGVTWRHIIGLGCLGGIGFTMSLFVATLGFGEGELLGAAKIGILCASVIAGSLGAFLLLGVKPTFEGRMLNDE